MVVWDSEIFTTGSVPFMREAMWWYGTVKFLPQEVFPLCGKPCGGMGQ